mmetsp:Transcript_4663/g.9382  ORF Transcript_4663/g.9382 Transcript_4663/m.9382 type:complete len:93 (-) Transcript_4663:402-680(-)
MDRRARTIIRTNAGNNNRNPLMSRWDGFGENIYGSENELDMLKHLGNTSFSLVSLISNVDEAELHESVLSFQYSRMYLDDCKEILRNQPKNY